MKGFKKRFRVIQLIIGVVITLWIFYFIGFEKLISAASKIDPLFIFIILILQIVLLSVGAFNTWLLFKPLAKKSLSFTKMLKYYCISWMISLFIPGRIGEFSIIHYLRKEDASVGEGLSLTVFDKLISLLVILIFSFIGLLVFLPSAQYFQWLFIILGVVVILFMLMLSKRVRKFMIRRVLRKYAKFFKGFNKSNLTYIKSNKKVLLINFFITVARHLWISFITYVIFIALGVHIGYWEVLLITSLTQLIKMIPITINGLGTTEAFRYYMYTFFIHVPEGVVGAMLGVNLALRYFSATAIYLIYGKDIVTQKKNAEST